MIMGDHSFPIDCWRQANAGNTGSLLVKRAFIDHPREGRSGDSFWRVISLSNETIDYYSAIVTDWRQLSLILMSYE
jgi:hypothetical protein